MGEEEKFLGKQFKLHSCFAVAKFVGNWYNDFAAHPYTGNREEVKLWISFSRFCWRLLRT